MIIKICGLSTPEAVDAVATHGGDMAGFIFFAKSPRHVSLETASALAARAKASGLASVAVTVDADDAEFDDIVLHMQPDWLQLHGHETPERVQAIKARYGLPIIKALPVSTGDDLYAATAYRGIADRFLFDAKPPKNAVLPGGNAISFDWSLLKAVPQDIVYLLAGGLDQMNVKNALVIAAPPGLDISSGVETAPGIKDIGKIAAFLKAARFGA
jgi:phosphoribosylanthranilate isomerase